MYELYQVVAINVYINNEASEVSHTLKLRYPAIAQIMMSSEPYAATPRRLKVMCDTLTAEISEEKKKNMTFHRNLTSDCPLTIISKSMLRLFSYHEWTANSCTKVSLT